MPLTLDDAMGLVAEKSKVKVPGPSLALVKVTVRFAAPPPVAVKIICTVVGLAASSSVKTAWTLSTCVENAAGLVRVTAADAADAPTRTVSAAEHAASSRR
jgi:hypothetical protein